MVGEMVLAFAGTVGLVVTFHEIRRGRKTTIEDAVISSERLSAHFVQSDLYAKDVEAHERFQEEILRRFDAIDEKLENGFAKTVAAEIKRLWDEGA